MPPEQKQMQGLTSNVHDTFRKQQDHQQCERRQGHCFKLNALPVHLSGRLNALPVHLSGRFWLGGPVWRMTGSALLRWTFVSCKAL